MIEKFMEYGIFNMKGGSTTLYSQKKISVIKDPQFTDIFNLCLSFVKNNNADISKVIGPPKKEAYSKKEKVNFIHTIAAKLNSSAKSLIRPEEETIEESKPKAKAKTKEKQYLTPQAKPKYKYGENACG